LRRVPSQPKGVKDGPSNPSPTHFKTKTLTQKFYHLIPGEKPTGCGEPILEESTSCTNQTSKGIVRKKVSKIKRDLFPSLI